MKPRNYHALNAILRRSDRFPMHCDTSPQCEDDECPTCGEWLNTDGECEDCDHDEDCR